MSRREALYINDMIKACEKIGACMERLGQEALEADWMRYDAVLRNLEVLGEAAKGVSPELRDRYPAIPWRKVAAMRDIVIHRYFGLDHDAIWDAAKNRVPRLLDELRRIRQDANADNT